MRSRSSTQAPAGRQSSRMLQVLQLTSNFRAGWMRMAAACMGSPSVGAARDHVAHALELAALVEEPPRPEALCMSPVGLGGEVAQHVDVDARLALVHLAQHVEAAGAPEAQVEQHHV